nr:hypothetical protein [uncultured Cohaesibacter sp.]
MCDPFAIIGGAMSLAAGAAQGMAQQSYVGAQNKARRDAYDISKRARESEIERQKQFEEQAQGYFDDTQTALNRENYDQTQQADAQSFVDYFNNEAPKSDQYGAMLSGQKFSNKTITDEIASQANSAAEETRKRVQALAKLNAYGTTGQSRGIALNDSAGLLTTLNGIRRGSLSVSNQEQSISPAVVSPPNTTFADILSGTGGLVSSFAG